MRYTLKQLKNKPTITVGHFDNLKVQGKDFRVWLSRCTVQDGEPYNNKVTVERLVNGCWVESETYQAR